MVTRDRLTYALNRLDEAYTLASSNNAGEASLEDIRFYQCAIAMRMGAIKPAEAYFKEVSQSIESEIRNLELNTEHWRAMARVLSNQYKAKDQFTLDDPCTQRCIRKLAKLALQDREEEIGRVLAHASSYELAATNLKIIRGLFMGDFRSEPLRQRVLRDTNHLVRRSLRSKSVSS